jgi:hypothetical protein
VSSFLLSVLLASFSPSVTFVELIEFDSVFLNHFWVICPVSVYLMDALNFLLDTNINFI